MITMLSVFFPNRFLFLTRLCLPLSQGLNAALFYENKNPKEYMFLFLTRLCLPFSQGLNAALFYENKNPKEYISLVPTSAHSGDGMGNLVALICELCQTMLPKRLMYSPNLQAVTMEVRGLSITGWLILS